ncbi:hypothetical protein NITLEN_10456 [Nitrospira lenta]|uniref:Uncharacterized protein n=1 Tax=Nitrospira lenta TaxID=1436998 RepID=A0A330L0W3_9BACT|nr:hypothetical protein NITLEN_10456 [Nitrospira lenta]
MGFFYGTVYGAAAPASSQERTRVDGQSRQPAHDGSLRCACGQLIARWTRAGVEIKCKRCRRLVCVPLELIRGTPPRMS